LRRPSRRRRDISRSFSRPSSSRLNWEILASSSATGRAAAWRSTFRARVESVMAFRAPLRQETRSTCPFSR